MSTPSGPYYYFTDLETNVLQVAIDHMIEHLEDVYGASLSHKQTRLEDEGRLEAAKRLKERLA
tara:strand:+ start:219 stop:407 length:189 start_codon:yes stop_codon:yes gene_type:complete